MKSDIESKVFSLDDACADLYQGIEAVFRQEPMSRFRYMHLYSLVYSISSNSVDVSESLIQARSSSSKNAANYPVLDRQTLAKLQKGSKKQPLKLHNFQSIVPLFKPPSSAPIPALASLSAVQSVQEVKSEQVIYTNLMNFIHSKVKDEICERCKDARGEELLRIYSIEWKNYELGCRVLAGICSYIDRYWGKRQLVDTENMVLPLYGLGMRAWWAELGCHVQDALTQVCIDEINRQRDGELINSHLIGSVVECTVQMDAGERSGTTNDVDGGLTIYRVHFEKKLLDASTVYYINESTHYVVSGRASEYLDKVFTRIKDENVRVTEYLHESTREKMIKVLESAYILNHLDYISEEFNALLVENCVSDLHKMYNLLRKSPFIDNLRDLFYKNVLETGKDAIEKMNSDSLDPQEFFNTMLSLHKRFDEILRSSFENEPMFSASVDQAFGSFLNDNKITAASKNSNKCAELLAKYVDQCMKKIMKKVEGVDIDSICSEIMIIFNYIKNKDVFQRYYGTLLAKRLIIHGTANKQAEQTMLCKLKQSCGNDYILKLMRMFHDVSLSKDLGERFKVFVEKELQQHLSPINFNVLVISYGSWPQVVSLDWTMPPEIRTWSDTYTDYYLKQHNGRKLTWLWNQSRAEILSHCFSTRYILITSAYQAMVLSLFNSRTSITFDVVRIETNGDDEILQGVMNLFVKIRLLNCDQPEEQDTYPPNAVFSVNIKFKSKKHRININLPTRYEAKVEQEKVHKILEEDRIILIQSTIVRLMKSKKIMTKNKIVTEVISELNSRFKPSMDSITKALDKLLDKEYITKHTDSGMADNYMYIT